MLAVGRGDVESLGELFRRHHERVHALCYRLTMHAEAADDLVQETFLRLLRYREGYRADARFTTWVYRVARNTCVDHLARVRRDEDATARWSAEVDKERDQHEPSSDPLLEHAMALLNPERREALVLARYEGLSYDELARVLDCTPGAARVRVHRALTDLRTIYRTLERKAHGLPADARADD
jgi:RNA polymerase sigma factor (sigma-70 family)